MSEALTVRCECGEPTCEEAVPLTSAALEAARRTNELVLAPGHPIGRAHAARRQAAATREDAKAVSAQAAHARRRARETLAAVRPPGRVLVVNDNVTFLRAAASVVLATERLRWVGSVVSGEEAIRVIPLLRPDLVLVDIHMPGMNGIETARIIQRQHPEIMVALISLEPEGFTDMALLTGAVAVLHKVDLSPAQLDELWLRHRPGN